MHVCQEAPELDSLSVLVNIEERYGESTAAPGVREEPTLPTHGAKDGLDGKRADRNFLF